MLRQFVTEPVSICKQTADTVAPVALYVNQDKPAKAGSASAKQETTCATANAPTSNPIANTAEPVEKPAPKAKFATKDNAHRPARHQPQNAVENVASIPKQITSTVVPAAHPANQVYNAAMAHVLNKPTSNPKNATEKTMIAMAA
jgi:hypothetical protein